MTSQCEIAEGHVPPADVGGDPFVLGGDAVLVERLGETGLLLAETGAEGDIDHSQDLECEVCLELVGEWRPATRCSKRGIKPCAGIQSAGNFDGVLEVKLATLRQAYACAEQQDATQ